MKSWGSGGFNEIWGSQFFIFLPYHINLVPRQPEPNAVLGHWGGGIMGTLTACRSSNWAMSRRPRSPRSLSRRHFNRHKHVGHSISPFGEAVKLPRSYFNCSRHPGGSSRIWYNYSSYLLCYWEVNRLISERLDSLLIWRRKQSSYKNPFNLVFIVMSKLSAPLKALIGAAHARPNTLPAPPTIRAVYEKLRTEAVAKDVDSTAWLSFSVSISVQYSHRQTEYQRWQHIDRGNDDDEFRRVAHNPL